MQRLDSIGTIDVASTVSYLRAFRAGTVQTLAQYRFVYDAIVAYYRANPSSAALVQRATTRMPVANPYHSGNLFLDVPEMGPSDIMNQPETDDPEFLIRALSSMT